MKIQYTELELLTASISASNKIDDNGEKLEVIAKDMVLGETGAELDKRIAKEYGLTILDFINSPNYSTIKQKYLEEDLSRIMNKMKEVYNLTDKEAWAVVYRTIKE